MKNADIQIVDQTETECDLESLPWDFGEIEEATGLEIVRDFTIDSGDNGRAFGTLVLVSKPRDVVALLTYDFPEYCDDECDGHGWLNIERIPLEAFDQCLERILADTWRRAMATALHDVKALLGDVPEGLAARDAVRTILENLAEDGAGRFAGWLAKRLGCREDFNGLMGWI